MSRVYLKCHAVSQKKKPNKRWIVGRVVSRCTVAANKLCVYIYILRQHWWRKKSFAERVIIPVFYFKAVTKPLPALDNILVRISYRVIVLILCYRYNVWVNHIVSQCNNNKKLYKLAGRVAVNTILYFTSQFNTRSLTFSLFHPPSLCLSLLLYSFFFPCGNRRVPFPVKIYQPNSGLHLISFKYINDICRE